MAEGTILIRDSRSEQAKDFNERLREAWSQEPIGQATLSVVEGVPVVSMIGALEAATAEDVENQLADAEGDAIQSMTPVGFAVCQVNVANPGKTEDRLDALCEQAGSSLVDIQIVTGDTFTWIEHPTTGDQLYVPAKVTYAMVVWEIEFVDEDEESEEPADEESEEEAEEAEEVEEPEEGDDDD